MELDEKKEFVWSSLKEKCDVKDLAQDLGSSKVVDNNECVIADIDYFLYKGITFEDMNGRHLITTLQMLEEAFRKINQGVGGCIYHPDKLITMANIIFRRWRGKSLNNESLENEINHIVVSNVINSWCISDAIKRQNTVLVHGVIDKEVQQIVKNIVEKFMLSKYDDTYDFDGLKGLLIQELEEYYRLHRESKHKNDLVALIDQEKEKTFIMLFKQKDLDETQLSSLEEDIENNWIHTVQHRKYVKSVSSLDYYCWELAVAEARESGRYCTVRMEKLIKSGLRKIVDAWRKNVLPNLPQLEGHLKKYLVDYYHSTMTRESEVDQLITRRVVGCLIAQRSPALIDFLQKIGHSAVSVHVFKQMKLLSHSHSNQLIPIVMNMVERYKTGVDCEYHSELREIAAFVYERLVNTGMKVEEALPMPPGANRYRFINGSTSLNEARYTNECQPDEMEKKF